MFGKLGEALKKATDKIASALFVNKALIDSIVKDLQRALIEADVNISLVKEISESIRKAAESRVQGVEKKEHIIKLLHDKILEMIGGEKKELEIKPGKKIMLLGLYGSGKTSTSAKLANYYSKRGFKTCMLGLDVHRPAAADQLEQLAIKNNLQAFIDKKEKNPIKIYEKYEKQLKDYDLVIVDTAGRHTLDSGLIDEIKLLGKKIKPDYILLVLPADIGQAAKTQAEQFQQALNISGVIITRMDSTAKGGGALTACNETRASIFFITTGEHIQDIEAFNPKSFISRILGLGDLQALLEKVSLVVDKDKIEEQQEKLKQGKFTMDDFYEQLKSIDNIGTFDKLMEMIPGLGKAKIPEGMLQGQEEKMKKWKFAIQSMTKEEKDSPEIIEKQTSRIARIAKGSGLATSDVRALLKQYSLLKDMLKSGQDFDPSKGMQGFSQKQLQKMAKKFGKKMRL
ncbi:MAG: signal recognition particle receptor subunit alpha [Candidatus Pacearchaeota archaeon]|nr:signal recognition particle receptor subunit alpha [Candidatus Pacearchaeota archaeon]